jgi:hypothetical protein
MEFHLTSQQVQGDCKVAAMKFQCAQALLSALVVLGAVPVRADDMVDNLNQPTENYFGPIGDDSSTNDFLIGQEFTLPAGATPYDLTGITLLLSATGGGANITVSVWNAGPDNNPTNEIAVVTSQFIGNAGNVDFVPSTKITLSSGIYYVVAAPTTPADSGWVSWAYAANTNWSGSGILGGFADTSSGAWGNFSITNNPQQMRVQAMPVAPALDIGQSAGVTTLSWPSTLTGYVVESATNLAAPAWQAITNSATLAGGDHTLTNRWSDPIRLFRLRQRFVVDNLEQPTAGWDGPIGTDANTNDFLIGQEFTLPAGNYTLNKLTLLLDPVYGSGSVTVSLWHAGLDNNPTNEIAVVASQLVTTHGNVDFVPSSPILLPSGTYYVVAAPTSSADNALVGWDWTFSATWTGWGTLGGYADTYAGGWENFPMSSGPYQMSVQATPTAP